LCATRPPFPFLWGPLASPLVVCCRCRSGEPHIFLACGTFLRMKLFFPPSIKQSAALFPKSSGQGCILYHTLLHRFPFLVSLRLCGYCSTPTTRNSYAPSDFDLFKRFTLFPRGGIYFAKFFEFRVSECFSLSLPFSIIRGSLILDLTVSPCILLPACTLYLLRTGPPIEKILFRALAPQASLK